LNRQAASEGSPVLFHRFLWGVALFVTAGFPAAAATQGPGPQARGTLDQVTMATDLRGSGDPRVVLTHALTVLEPDTHLSFKALATPGQVLSDVEVRVGADTYPLNLFLAAPGRYEATLEDVVFPIGGLQVNLSYLVEGSRSEVGEGHWYRLPLILPAWGASASPPNFFRAEVTLASEDWLSESFPSIPHVVTAGPESRLVTLSLQTVPSFVRLRVDTGARQRFTLDTVVDVVVVVTLLMAAAWGWRFLVSDLRAREGERA
jgi:hypothetical protein